MKAAALGASSPHPPTTTAVERPSFLVVAVAYRFRRKRVGRWVSFLAFGSAGRLVIRFDWQNKLQGSATHWIASGPDPASMILDD